MCLSSLGGTSSFWNSSTCQSVIVTEKNKENLEKATSTNNTYGNLNVRFGLRESFHFPQLPQGPKWSA